MINRLKQACGYEFTSKFHRMFTDILTAEELNAKFKIFLSNASADVGLSYFIRVLQQGAWPLSHSGICPIAIPLQLEKTVQMFEAFYSKQFSGRKLTWLHHLSNGDIKLGYTAKTYVINMTTTQMAVLLLFEKSDCLSYSELEETTKLSPDQFPRYVQSLLDAKLVTTNTETLEPSSHSISSTRTSEPSSELPGQYRKKLHRKLRPHTTRSRRTGRCIYRRPLSG